jgi:acyl dehydratase
MTTTTSRRVDFVPDVSDVPDVAARMHALVGQHYLVPDVYEVGREKIREYASAVQDDHPAHRHADAARELGYDNVIGSVTFVCVMGAIALEHLFEHVIDDYDPGTLMQIDQSFVMHRPVVVGDHLSSDLHLTSFRQIAGSDIMVIETDFTDADGAPVVTTRTTFIARTGSSIDPETAEIVRGVMATSSKAR